MSDQPIQLTPEQFAALSGNTGIPPGAILKWVAGIVGTVLGAVIIGSIMFTAGTMEEHDDRLTTLENGLETYITLQSQTNKQMVDSLQRIEGNTKDRITRDETMREITVLKEELAGVRDMAVRSLDKLADRTTFMIETTSDIEAIKADLAEIKEAER